MISFNDIEQFILHKNELCSKPEASGRNAEPMETESAAAVSAVTNLVHMPAPGHSGIGNVFCSIYILF